MKATKTEIIQACQSEANCQSIGKTVATQVSADENPPK